MVSGANINAINGDGWTALIIAAANGHTDIVNSLLANDANVDAIDKDGETALMSSRKWTYNYC